MPTTVLTILVSGMIAAVPQQGGATWAVLHYLLGFRRLGHSVYFVEQIAEAALQPAGMALSQSANAIYFREVMAAFRLTEHAALVQAGTRETVGLSYDALHEVARRADLLINLSGVLTDTALTAVIPLRAYLDLDPAFTQLWHTAQGIDMRFGGHTHFVTVGGLIGTPDCPVPTCGRAWIPILPPVVLAFWPAQERTTGDAFTTVANWRGYGPIEHDGIIYGQKAHSFRRFMTLPTRRPETFRLALAIHSHEEHDVAALAMNGWQVVDPVCVAGDPASYQRFIQRSKAEFSVAKSGYVAARCGWFSDRSACYLASGRPVIAQDTGFSRLIATGEGLFAFETEEDVLASVDMLNRDYTRHAHAARALAARHFDSDRVLTQLLQRLGTSS